MDITEKSLNIKNRIYLNINIIKGKISYNDDLIKIIIEEIVVEVYFMTDEKQEKLTEMVDEFCDEFLNDEYKQKSHEIIEKMANGKNVRFKRGKLEVWASAIIYVVCQINSLFDETNEVHLKRKDIFNYFNTNQSVVLRKAVNLKNIYKLDNKVSLNTEKPNFKDVEDEIYENIMKHDFGDDYHIFDNNMTVKDYQQIIDDYEQKFGEKFFKENQGKFWLIHETRPYMQCLLDQASLLWENGEKEKAINQYKYMLKLNPGDNQGVRDLLLPNLLELNRLDEAQELYSEYENDITANWKFGKLLMDIKNNVSFDEIEMQYKQCINYNPYVVPYLLGNKKLPKEMPYFHGLGDENEAVFYVLIAGDAWHGDKKAMKTLRQCYNSLR